MKRFKNIGDELAYQSIYHPVLYHFIQIVCIIVVIVVICFFIAGINLKRWDNGICDNCGGHYEFVGTRPIGRTSRYIYECDNCGRMNEFSTNPNLKY